MAEITSGANLTVMVLDVTEVAALRHLLNQMHLAGNEVDDAALDVAYGILDALDVEVTV
jgi:hypothetical protein